MVTILSEVPRLAARRYLTSWTLWLAAAPFLTVGLVFTEISGAWTLESVLTILAIGVIAHLALGGVWWIGALTVLRPKRRDRAGWGEVLALCFAGGVVRSLVIATLAVSSGVGELNLLSRLPTSVVLVTFSFVMAAYSAELWREYRERRASLLYSLALGESVDRSRELATSELSRVAATAIEGDIEAIRQRTQQALHELRNHLKFFPSDVDRVSELLEHTDQEWREVSHRLWKGSQPSVPRMSVRETLRTLVSAHPISLIVLSAGPVYGFFRVFSSLPLDARAGFAALWLAVSLGVAVVTNRLTTRAGRFAIPVFLVGFLGLQAWGSVIAELSLDDPGLRAQVSYVVFVSSTAAVALGLPQALRKSGQIVLEQLEDRLSARAIEHLKHQGEMFVLAQRIGMYLHAEVRGDFLRLAMELKQALERGEREKADQILSAMERRVEAVGVDSPTRSPLESLAEFLANWSSIITITSNLDDVWIPEALQRPVEIIVTDAVNDAVRHGGATWLSMYAVVQRDGVGLTIHSDSQVSEGVPREGMGSRTLTEYAPASWSRDVTEEGILQLTAFIPLERGKRQG